MNELLMVAEQPALQEFQQSRVEMVALMVVVLPIWKET